jgi:CarboxypepD_reg-like domain
MRQNIVIIRSYKNAAISHKFVNLTHMMKSKAFLLLMVLLLSGTTVFSQTAVNADSTRKVVQVSGMTIDADSLFPIPFVAVVIKGSSRGVYSTGTGYFSIVAQEKDTLEFFSLGYKTSTFILRDTFTVSQMNLVQTLKMDTVLLSEMVVYPWPSREKFKSAFLALDIPNDDLERARINLAQQRMIAAATNVSADGQGAYRAQMQQRTDKSYYAGQYQPNNLLNPVAWSKFIQSMRKQ